MKSPTKQMDMETAKKLLSEYITILLSIGMQRLLSFT